MDKISKYDEGEFKAFTTKAEYDKAINMLIGMLDGMNSDNVTVDEIEELRHWLQFSKPFSHKRPFSEIIPMVNGALDDGRIDQDEIDDILWVCNQFQSKNPYYDIITSGVQQLNGFIHGMMADNELTLEEITSLKKWIADHEELTGYFPYDEIYALLVSILKDGIVTDEEQNYLKAFLSQFIDTSKSLNLNENDLDTLRKDISLSGICALAPNIEFDNKKFCFTGESARLSRKELSEMVFNLNGQLSNNVTKDTSYLVIGAAGSECWAFSCYGRKVEKAIELRKKGLPIIIVHEYDFMDAVQDLL